MSRTLISKQNISAGDFFMIKNMKNKLNQHRIKSVDGNPDFILKENQLLEDWYKNGTVEKYLHKNDDSDKKFFFQDGPITANNPMGVHHAWGRTYKDMWQRYKNMQGFKQRFQNGFDCQGLWVEVEVEKDLGFKTKKDIETYGVANFVEKCKERVMKYSGIQTAQSKRLGYFMDWDHSYFTMSDDNNYTIWHFLKVCWEKGWIYRGNDTVPWCPRCETAISQHEMLTEDYKELTHKAISLSLPIVGRENEYLLIWTTTPWTIPGNIAVAVDEKQDYSLVKTKNGKSYWVIKERVLAIFEEGSEVLKTVKGSELVGLKYTAPFDSIPAVKEVADANPNKFHIVIATDSKILPISNAEGTGLVHTAVSAGVEDFALGKKHGLPFVALIADNADYLPGLGFLSGQNAKKHPEIILDHLTERDLAGDSWLFRVENFTHRYPACWRCKSELVWKISSVWYISMDKVDPTDAKGRTLRQKMIAVAGQINWMPKFGLDRELDWLNNMHDWLISKKNRYWGLALPFWTCDDCDHFEVIGSKDELETRSTSGWEAFSGHTPHRPFIDEVKIKCSQCGHDMTRITDVGNPWLDAGIVPFSTLVDPKTGKVSYSSDKEYWKEWFPADFVTESFPGQFKNWFYSLIAMSTVLEDTAPFKNILGFASLLAEDGRPMHKSWGNSIEFSEGADKMGADVMRWVYSRQNPERNILFGYKVVEETKRQFYMMLWNSFKYFANYADLENWIPTDEAPNTLTKLDQWILTRLEMTVIEATKSLDAFDSFTASGAIESFVQDLSLWYIRRSRDRVGPSATDKQDKEACYYTFRIVFDVLSRILMPFTPFIADQIYTNVTGEESVHLADWPSATDETVVNKDLVDKMSLVREICELGNAERKRIVMAIKQPLASLRVDNKYNSIAEEAELLQLIKDELNVEKIEFVDLKEVAVEYDTVITQDLKDKGKAREIVRSVQEARKNAGCLLDERIDLELPEWPKSQESEIIRKALVDTITLGTEVKVIKKAN